MKRIQLKQVDEISRKKIPDAYNSFMRQCKLKNLSPYSFLYYEKNIGFFLESLPESKYVDEITPETIENFISMLMDRGNRVTAINARLRGVYVFLRYCIDQKYMEGFPLMLVKEDESFKEPYSEAELRKLLEQPHGNSWAEWRTWAAINLLVAKRNAGKHLFQSHFPAYNIYPDDANLLHRKSKTNQLLSNFFRASSRHLIVVISIMI